jgi:2-epi-valiolone-7-phosphate 1-reductase
MPHDGAVMESEQFHQALVRQGSGLQVATVPTAAPGAGGVLVAPCFVGVCGTDLQILNGARPDTAAILGHEAAGVVVKAGPGASLREGQQVVFNPSAQLTRGRILGHNVPGLFQRYFPVDAQAVDDGLVQPVEEGLPTICGALVEPLGGVIYTHELISHVVPDLQTVAVFGAGPIGLIVTEYLRSLGMRVLLTHPRQERLDAAVQLELIQAGTSMTTSADLPARMRQWNGGKLFDAAVICTSMAGAAEALRYAVEVVRQGGCVQMVTNFPLSSPTPAGISAGDLRSIRAANICGVPAEGAYVFADVSGRRMAFTSHRGTSRNHLSLAMKTLRASASNYTALITHMLSLQEAAEALEMLAGTRSALLGGRDCIKAVIDLTRLACEPAGHRADLSNS